MSRVEKLLDDWMRTNPQDWRIESLEIIAKHYGTRIRKNGGSHFVLLHPDSNLAVTVPFKRPIKPVYISQFLALVDDIVEEI